MLVFTGAAQLAVVSRPCSAKLIDVGTIVPHQMAAAAGEAQLRDGLAGYRARSSQGRTREACRLAEP